MFVFPVDLPFRLQVSQHLDRTPFPAPATSNAACGFPALRSPVGFIPRLMRLIVPAVLSSRCTLPEVHLSVVVVFVRIDAPLYPSVGQGRQLHCHFSRLRLGSLSLQPAGLLDSLKEPLLGKLNVSGYPLHLPPATWANYRIPMVGL